MLAALNLLPLWISLRFTLKLKSEQTKLYSYVIQENR